MIENADAPAEATAETVVLSPRDRVAREAASRFIARGYQAVGLREIAKALDLQAASLYHHFPQGKTQLYLEAVCLRLTAVRAGLIEAGAGAENLKAALGSMADWLMEAPPLDVQRMLEVDRPALLDAAAQAALTEAVNQAVLGPFVVVCEAAVERNELRVDVEPQVLAAAALAVVQQLGCQQDALGRAAVSSALSVLVRGSTTLAFRLGRG